jgi:hypothetical protein
MIVERVAARTIHPDFFDGLVCREASTSWVPPARRVRDRWRQPKRRKRIGIRGAECPLTTIRRRKRLPDASDDLAHVINLQRVHAGDTDKSGRTDARMSSTGGGISDRGA